MKKVVLLFLMLSVLMVGVLFAWSAGPNYARSTHPSIFHYKSSMGVDGSANVGGYRYTKVYTKYTAPSGRTKDGSVRSYSGFKSSSFTFMDDLNPSANYPKTRWTYSTTKSLFQIVP
jgi:hypothetical protein